MGLRAFTYTYSAVAESKSNPVADTDALGDAAALTDDQFYMLLDGGMATAGDGDGICTSQSVSGQLAIDGADSEEKDFKRRVNYGMDAPRRVSFTSVNNNSGITITLKGKNGSGLTVSETLTGPNTASVYSANLYSVVELIYTDSASNALTVGDNAGYVDFGELARTVDIPSTATRRQSPIRLAVLMFTGLSPVRRSQVPVRLLPVARHISALCLRSRPAPRTATV